MWDAVFPYLAALLPTVAVAVLFYFLIKSILEGDRRERLAQSKWEKEHEQGSDTPKTPRNSQTPAE
jgi:hypothetical protein